MSEVGDSYSFGEAILLVRGLQKEFGSHLFAQINEWDFAVTYGELMAGVHASGFINVHRDTKKYPQPVELPMPWPSKNAAPNVTPEERAALKASLQRRSAFASRPE